MGSAFMKSTNPNIGKKIPESSKRQNLNLLHAWNNWQSISISLGILSNLAIVVVQLLSLVWLFATPWTAACQTSLFFTISRSLLKLMSIEPVMPPNHLILVVPCSSCPLSSAFIYMLVCVYFEGVALLISFKNWFFALMTWLFDAWGLTSSLS